MKEIIEKSKFKIKKLPHRIVTDEKGKTDEEIIVKKTQSFFCKYWTESSFENTSIKYTF